VTTTDGTVRRADRVLEEIDELKSQLELLACSVLDELVPVPAARAAADLLRIKGALLVAELGPAARDAWEGRARGTPSV
jgi:hypothetical protein